MRAEAGHYNAYMDVVELEVVKLGVFSIVNFEAVVRRHEGGLNRG
jgi:hypothetical protein